MKSSDATTTNHPPLAHDAQGHPIAMPEGSAFWTLKRHTTGRPKTIMGPDRRAVRLPLDTTEQEIADTYGPGTYRLDALDALGNPLDHVRTLVVGDDDACDDDDDERSRTFLATRNGDSDLRAALETTTEMARALSSSLNAVAAAQADWVKGLASARALPRNVAFAAQQPQLPPPPETDENDEEDVDEDEPEQLPPYAVVAQAAHGIVQSLPSMMLQFSQMISAISAARKAGQVSTVATPATGRNPMVHLAEINERLTAAERRFLSHVLRSQMADTLTQELLARSVDDGVALIRDAIAQARSAREPAEAPPSPSAAAPDFMSHVAAVAMLLSPDERAEVMSLLPRLKPARVEQLKNQLLAMSVDDAVAWIRQNLAVLKAEVAS